MQNTTFFLSLFFGLLTCSAEAQALLNDESLRAQTLSPLSASGNRSGDLFNLLVLSPERWKDALIEGEIAVADSGGKTGSSSRLSFVFRKMALAGGEIVSIRASMIGMINSKGQEGVDDEGHAIGQKSIADGERGEGQPKKSKNVFSRFGKKVAKGAKGLAQKIAGGVTIAFTSNTQDIRFEAGSIFTLSVSSADKQEDSKSDKEK